MEVWTPDFKITGLSKNANDRMLSITVEDSAGIQSDKVTVKLDDREYRLKWPPKGLVIQVELGYKERGLVNMGTFEIDEPKHSEPPATIEFTANAQKHSGSNIKAPLSQPWDEKKLEEVVGQVAQRNGYTPEVDPAVASIWYDHLDQCEESDIHFLSRLAEKHDCYVKYQDGKLLFKPREKTNGLIIVQKGNILQNMSIMGGLIVTVGTSISATVNTRNQYGSTKAAWHDMQTGERKYETVSGGEGPTFEIRQPMVSQQDAKLAAEAQFKKLERTTGSIDSLTFPGDPTARAEMDLVLVNFRPELCEDPWVITNVTHSMDNSGYRTTVKAERKGSGPTLSGVNLSEEGAV